MLTDMLDRHAHGILSSPVYYRYFDQLSDLYFHGVQLWRVIFLDFFRQFGHSHLRHGLCFQTAGLAMLIYRDNPSATLVQGMVKNPTKDFYTPHSWVELSDLGSRYVLDMTWNFPSPVPISLGYGQIGEVSQRWTCSHEEFWRSEIPHELRKFMENSETSYILQALDIFCPAFEDKSDGVRRWGFRCGGDDYGGLDDLNYEKTSLQSDEFFRRDNAMYWDAGGVPVTQGMINAFMAKPGRKVLPKRVWRKEGAKVKARYKEVVGA